MNDIDFIKENYSKMNDNELQKLWIEKYKLRPEVIEVLKKELIKREIEFENFDQSRENTNIPVENNLKTVHENLNNFNKKKKNIIQVIENYHLQNRDKKEIYRKIETDFNVDRKVIDDIYSSRRTRGNFFIFIGIIFLLPAILRSIIIGNTRENTNLVFDLLYVLLFGVISIVAIYNGIKLKRNFK